MRLHLPSSTVGIVFFIVSVSIQAQSLSLDDDRKRFILEGIKPTEKEINSNFKYSIPEIKANSSDNILGTTKNYKSGGAEFESRYDVKAIESTIKGADLFKPDGNTETKIIIDGGKIYQVKVKESDYQLNKLSQRHRLQGIMINVTVGGFNFSGWQKKKLSKKSKNILQNVYGIEINEN